MVTELLWQSCFFLTNFFNPKEIFFFYFCFVFAFFDVSCHFEHFLDTKTKSFELNFLFHCFFFFHLWMFNAISNTFQRLGQICHPCFFFFVFFCFGNVGLACSRAQFPHCWAPLFQLQLQAVSFPSYSPKRFGFVTNFGTTEILLRTHSNSLTLNFLW